MTKYTPGRKGRARGTTRRGRLLAALTATVAIAVLPALAVVSPASAAPKGTLAAASGTTAGLTPGQNVNLTLTNYPAENVLVKYCELTMAGFVMAVGDCAAAPVTVTVPDAGGGRGNTTATATAQRMIGAKDCAAATMCGFVTESAGAVKNPDSDVKLTVAFGGIPKLEVLNRAPSTADNSEVTVRGTGFRPGITLRLTQCNNSSVLSTPPCRTTLGQGYAEPTTDASGAFETKLTVSTSFVAGTPAATQNCTDGSIVCGVQTSSKVSGADRTQQAKVDLDFGGTLTASKVSGISAGGESITVTGTGFQPNISLYLSNCDTAVPAGGACDMANLKQVPTNASGGFTQVVKVGSFAGTDCLVKACGLQTSKIGAGADASQTATLPLKFVAAPPAVTAKLTASKTTGINSGGESLKVDGTGFAPNVSLYLALCNTKVPAGGACDMANFKQVRTDAAGTFPTTAITVAGSFTGGNGSKVDCLSDPCALQTSKVGAGADASQIATLPLTFVKGSTQPPKPTKPTLVAPKVVKSGSTVKIKGSGFKPGTKITTALCKTSAKPGKQCWTAKAKTVKVNSGGGFTAKVKVAKTFKSKQGKVNCGKSKCAIKTWNAKKPSQRSSQLTHKVKFGAKTARTATVSAASASGLTPAFAVRSARAGASMSVSKTSGIASGESVTVKGSGFKPKVGLYLALCNTDVPAGGACDMSNFKQLQTDASGAFPSTSIKVMGTFTGADGSAVDCSSDPCALQTSQVGAGSDTTQTVTVPLSFGGSTGGDSGDGDDSGDSGDDSASGGGGTTASGGSASDGSASSGGSESSSGGGAVLPQTGAGDELWLGIVGLLMVAGGLALSLRRSARTA